tara:strand:+ start:477 stop:1919 length:1443 start_codon:yes stop_codon:yes gene_type:complete
MSYTTEVTQSLPFYVIPVGQELIVGLSCDLCVAEQQNVKFCFQILVCIDSGQCTDLGVFKTTPNNAGVGFLDVSTLLDNYVSADNIASSNSTFKFQGASGQPFPTHLIDEYSRADNSVRLVNVNGYTEYTDSLGNIQTTDAVSVVRGSILNTYVKESDLLKWTSATFMGDAFGFSFSLEDYAPIEAVAGAKFLSNSPSTLYAGLNDYGTLSFLAVHNFTDEQESENAVTYYQVDMYDSSDSSLGNFTVERTEQNGAFDGTANVPIRGHVLYIAAFPGNLVVNDAFNDETDDMAYYTIGLYDVDDVLISEEKRIDILCPNLKGYTPVRLTWLNQFGTWDYFTFNQKSVKKIATKGTTYQQLGGTWNKNKNRPYGYKGGKKSFRVNGTETIKMNTDYLTEEHSEWFEELINSPEIYILKERSGIRQQDQALNDTLPIPMLNQYMTPCTLKTTSFTKKTVANDKLIQYTFEVEKARNLRTQAI